MNPTIKQLQKKTKPQAIKMAPSKARILNMPHDILLGHYGLISIKKSNLSSTQRMRVQKRVQHLLLKGAIRQQQIDDTLNNIKDVS